MKMEEFDYMIKDSLTDAAADVKMSENLKGSIKSNAAGRHMYMYHRLKRIMNTTIQISMPSVAVCIILAVFVFAGIMQVFGIRKDKSLQGYTSVRIVDLGEYQIIMDKNQGGAEDGLEDKN